MHWTTDRVRSLGKPPNEVWARPAVVKQSVGMNQAERSWPLFTPQAVVLLVLNMTQPTGKNERYSQTRWRCRGGNLDPWRGCWRRLFEGSKSYFKVPWGILPP